MILSWWISGVGRPRPNDHMLLFLDLFLISPNFEFCRTPSPRRGALLPPSCALFSSEVGAISVVLYTHFQPQQHFKIYTSQNCLCGQPHRGLVVVVELASSSLSDHFLQLFNSISNQQTNTAATHNVIKNPSAM